MAYTANLATIPGATKRDVAQAEAWRREGRSFAPHHGTPVHYPGSLKLAIEESKAFGLKGAERLLYIAERYEGWLPAKSAAVGEGGLVSIASLGGLKGETVHGPGRPQPGGGAEHPGGTTPGSATAAEHVAENPLGALGELGKAIVEGLDALVKAYGLRLAEVLGGAALILFGLAVLAKGGQAPNLPRAVPVPV